MYDTRTMVDNSDHLHSYLKSYVEEYHQLRTTEKVLLQHVANDEFDSFQEVIRRAHKRININAHNMWNQTSLILAIRNGNSDFVEYLLEQHQQNLLLGEALPFAIHLNKIQIVEILLKFIERTDCEPYTLNYRSKYCGQSMMVIAARNNNYDMIYLLFKYGFPPIEQPEELTYECTLEEVTQIYHTYHALSSMSYICITENDPILRAFMLTDKLNEIAASKYCVAKDLYEELSGRVSKIPGKLMSLCHNNEEVRCLLNTDLGFPKDASGNTMIYPRAMLAVAYGQKEFVADDKCQRFLSDSWVSDKVHKKSMTFLKQVQQIVVRVLMLPVISCVLWFAPHSKLASRWTSPVEQFLNHNSSYIMFLVVLFLHSDNKRIHYIPGSGLLLIIYVQSLAILEYKTYRHMGSELYFRQRWKIFNIGMIILFDIAFLFWGYNHYISRHSLLDRKFLTSYDPVMIAEVIYAIATLMSWWKLMYFVQIYRKMGPLTVSLSSIAGKSAATYITIYIILMMGFASCMFTLYTPYTDEVRYFAGKVHEHPEHFISMVSSIKSCYWATFGYGPPEFADLVTSEYYDVENNHVIAKVNKHGFTEGVGYVVFALVNVVMTTLMSNLLMAVIAKDLDDVDENAVLEWKFARTQVWISYFGKHPMIPPPFNVFPTFTDIKWALGAIKEAVKISTSTIPQMSEEKRCLLRRNRRNYLKLMAVLTLRYYKHVEYIERPSKEHY